MSMNLLAKKSASIHAPVEKVWEALTKPELIKQYFFGTEAVSDWKQGSPLTFKGVWEGKHYEDKGTIVNIQPTTYLRYTYLSSMSGKEDLPENYAHVTYELSEDGESTLLTVTQDNVENEKSRVHSEENWGVVLNSLKEMLEKEAVQK